MLQIKFKFLGKARVWAWWCGICWLNCCLADSTFFTVFRGTLSWFSSLRAASSHCSVSVLLSFHPLNTIWSQDSVLESLYFCLHSLSNWSLFSWYSILYLDSEISAAASIAPLNFIFMYPITYSSSFACWRGISRLRCQKSNCWFPAKICPSYMFFLPSSCLKPKLLEWLLLVISHTLYPKHQGVLLVTFKK